MITVLVFLFTFGIKAEVQRAPDAMFSLAQDPSTTKWQHVQGDYVHIIFPQGMEERAKKIIGLIDHIAPKFQEDFSLLKNRKIELVLRGNTRVSNGFVTYAPRRSEWMTTPLIEPGLSQTNWDATLAIHEYRHVAQLDKAYERMNGFLYALFGELGISIGVVWSQPPWYFEGDAVRVETKNTQAGRGRLGNFSLLLRGALENSNEFSYEQFVLGTLNYNLPNYYVYGYFMTGFLEEKYGQDFVEKVYFKALRSAYNPFSFLTRIEEASGKKIDEIHQEMLSYLKEKFSYYKPRDNSKEILPLKKKLWTSYRSVMINSEGHLISLRSGLDYLKQFVKIHEGKEEVLYTPSSLAQEYPYKLRDDLFAFTEVSLDSRWGMQDYAKIKVINSKTGDVVYTSKNGKYLHPILSHDAKRVFVYQYDPTGQCRFLLIDYQEDKVLKNYLIGCDDFVTSFDFYKNNQVIYLQRTDLYDQQLVLLDLNSGASEVLKKMKNSQWSYISIHKDEVFFQKDLPYGTQIYSFDLKRKVESQVTRQKLGAYDPGIYQNKLIFSAYYDENEKRGFRPHYVSLDDLNDYRPYTKNPPLLNEGEDLLESTSAGELKVEKYSQFKNAFNPHSWAIIIPPFYPGVIAQLQSNDILGNLNWINGVEYYVPENSNRVFSSLTLTHFYPILGAKALYGKRKEDHLASNEESHWEENSAELFMQLPYRKLVNSFHLVGSLKLSGELLKSVGRNRYERGDVYNDTLLNQGAGLSFSFSQRKTSQDVITPFGIELQGEFKEGKSILGKDSDARYKFGQGIFFLPSLFKNNVFWGEVAYEEQEFFDYHFATMIQTPRGHESSYSEWKFKRSFNYLAPIAKPDYRLKDYFYLKRVSANIFYDAIDRRLLNFQSVQESAGLELWLESHFFRNMIPINWGIRYSRLLGNYNTNELGLFLNSVVYQY